MRLLQRAAFLIEIIDSSRTGTCTTRYTTLVSEGGTSGIVYRIVQQDLPRYDTTSYLVQWCDICFAIYDGVGDKYMITLSYTDLTFSGNTSTFLPRSRVFSRALGCWARRRLACTPWCKCGFRPGSVVLGLPGRDLWQTTTGSCSNMLEPSRPMGNPELSLFYIFNPATCCFSYRSSP